MENEAVSAEKAPSESASYTYWVRGVTGDAAPLPAPKKIDPSNQNSQTHLGSAWNAAGTWEEKNLNKWASDRINELLVSVGSLEFSNGKAEIAEVTRCSGDAFLVTVRNKKRIGYTYELTLKVKGEWKIGGESKKLKAHIDIPEFSYGDLDELEFHAKISNDEDVPAEDRTRIIQDLKSFLPPVRGKLLQFEEELKAR